MEGEKRPQFFKVLMPGFAQKLLIPSKFVGTHLTNEDRRLVTILSPKHKLWHIKLTRDAQDVYFDNGWGEFVKSHDLLEGYFLVFRYIGNMVFTLKVFDLSGCHKRYGEIESANADQVQVEAPRLTKVSETPKLTKVSETPKLTQVPESNTQRMSPRLRNVTCRDIDTVQHLSTKNDEMPGPLFRRTFRRTIAQWCYARNMIIVPRKFCDSNGFAENQAFLLKDAEHREWDVEFKVTHTYSYLGKGWREFCEGNELECDDECVFELVGKGVMSVKVVRHSLEDEVVEDLDD